MKWLRCYLALLSALVVVPAFAAYPERPVKLIIGFGPGTAIDTLGRMFAEDFTAATGQPLIVENKPGANSAIAAETVARAPRDGYTLLLASNTSHAANPALMKRLGYDPVKDFSPIGRVASIPFVLVTGPSAPFASVNDLVSYAKANPGKLTYASSNSGSLVAGALLSQSARIDMVHVPYKSSPQALSDVMAGHVSFLFVDPLASMQQVASGKLKAIGVTSRDEIPQLPDVPSIASALGGNPIVAWYAMFAPAGTPDPVVDQLHLVLTNFLSKPGNTEKFAQLGITPWPSTPNELRTFVQSEAAVWRTIIQRAGIEPQ
ncbi:hypothetical protein LMG26689_02614 [Achromobacter animicus]|nr:hypothetical protein LMG26689_02614 [Achromobacter animicus]